MVNEKIKKVMQFGPNSHMCDVSEIADDHIHLESWNQDIEKKEFIEIAKLIESDRYDVEGFELVEIPHPECFCFANYQKEKYFDIVKFWNDRWQFSYLELTENGWTNKPACSIADAIEKYQFLNN